MLQTKSGKVRKKSTSPVEYFPLNEGTGIFKRTKKPNGADDFGVASRAEFTHNGLN